MTAFRTLGTAGIIASLVVLPSASGETLKRGQNFPISIAAKVPAKAQRGGPIFGMVKKAIAIDESESDVVFSSDVKLVFGGNNKNVVGYRDVADVLRTIRASCKGPYTIDESEYPEGEFSSWAQTSWVCRVGTDDPVRKYFDFRFSPEIDISFSFKDGKVAKIFAMELVPLPTTGFARLGMDAFDHVRDPD